MGIYSDFTISSLWFIWNNSFCPLHKHCLPITETCPLPVFYSIFCFVGIYALKWQNRSKIGAMEEQNSWFYSMNHLHRNYAGSLPCDCYPGCSQGGSEECKEFFQGHWGKPAVHENINLKLKLNNIIYAMQRIYVKLLTDLKLVSWYNRGWWWPVVGCAGSVGAGALVCVWSIIRSN